MRQLGAQCSAEILNRWSLIITIITIVIVIIIIITTTITTKSKRRPDVLVPTR
jgi:uncharacterized membrane protein